MAQAQLAEIDRRNGQSLLLNPATGTWAVCTPRQSTALLGSAALRTPENAVARGAALAKRLLTVDSPPALSLPPMLTGQGAAYISLTDRCNLRCRYCYAEGMAGPMAPVPADEGCSDGPEIGTGTVVALLGRLAAAGHSKVHFTGGEALLRKDLEAILASATEHGLQSTVLTNGTLITPAHVRIFSRNRVSVSVSLDSYHPSEHDYHRGKGTFNVVLRRIMDLRAEGVTVGLNAVLTRVNWYRAGDFYALARLLGLGLSDLRMVLFMPMGRGASLRRYVLELDQLVDLRGRLRSAAAYWFGEDEIRRVALGQFPGPGKVRLSCGAGQAEFAVGADGHLYPCRLMQQREFRAGAALSEDLMSLRRRAVEMARTVFDTVLDHEECARCRLRLLCGGGCRVAHAAFSGDPAKNSPYWCSVLRGEIIENLWQRSDLLIDGVRSWEGVSEQGGLRPAPGTCWTTRPDEKTVLANALANRVRMLNPAGSRIWAHLTTRALAPEEKDAVKHDFIMKLVEEGFLQKCG